MCGGGGTPKVVTRDPKAEADAAAAEAAQKANAETAARKMRRRGTSLLASGATGVTTSASALGAAAAKPTLGA